MRATGMTLKVVEYSWLPRSGGSETAACRTIMPVHRTAAPSGRARSPAQRSAVLPDALVEGARSVERYGVELCQFGVFHPPPQSACIVLGLLCTLGARDRDDTLGDDPGQGNLARGAIAVGRPDAP